MELKKNRTEQLAILGFDKGADKDLKTEQKRIIIPELLAASRRAGKAIMDYK